MWNSHIVVFTVIYSTSIQKYMIDNVKVQYFKINGNSFGGSQNKDFCLQYNPYLYQNIPKTYQSPHGGLLTTWSVQINQNQI